MFEYKPIHNTWTQRAEFPGTSTGGSYGFSILQRGFVSCGYVGGLSTVTDQVWSFYPGTNSWHMELAFPGITRRFPVAFAIHDRGYFGTGTNGINLNDFWQYNPTINTSEIEEQNPISWKVYPNPTADFLHIQMNQDLDPNTVGELLDLTGKLVLRVPLTSGVNQIDVQSLMPGTYIFCVQNQGMKTTKQINIF